MITGCPARWDRGRADPPGGATSQGLPLSFPKTFISEICWHKNKNHLPQPIYDVNICCSLIGQSTKDFFP